MAHTRDEGILVIGLGNEFRSDDRVGLLVAEKIRELDIPGVSVDEEIKECSGLIDKWQGSSLTILVDAVVSKQPPGTIHRFDVIRDGNPRGLFTRFSTHAFSVTDAIDIGQALDQLPPALLIYGIECNCFDRSREIQPAVEEAVNQLIEQIRRDIDRFKAGNL